MNAKIAGLGPLVLEGAELSLVSGVVHFNGVLSMRSPSESLAPFLRQVHDATVQAGQKRLSVDLTKLQFMNSSSIRCFVDWIEWIRKEPDPRQYTLHFITKPDAGWQATTLGALQVHGGQFVVVQRGS